MPTLTLIGIGNENGRSYFILAKENLFRNYFNEILDKLDIKDQIYEEQGVIEERVNETDHFKNEKFDIDVIYTETRIIILVRANTKNLKEFKSVILAYSKMSE